MFFASRAKTIIFTCNTYTVVNIGMIHMVLVTFPTHALSGLPITTADQSEFGLRQRF